MHSKKSRSLSTIRLTNSIQVNTITFGTSHIIYFQSFGTFGHDDLRRRNLRNGLSMCSSMLCNWDASKISAVTTIFNSWLSWELVKTCPTTYYMRTHTRYFWMASKRRRTYLGLRWIICPIIKIVNKNYEPKWTATKISGTTIYNKCYIWTRFSMVCRSEQFLNHFW